ncbi:MAG: Na(+)/H(+) antiporter subunit D [Dehalococcoidia bacterium]
MSSLPPVLIMLAAAAIILVAPRHIRRFVAVAAPALVFAQFVWIFEPGDTLNVNWLSLELQPLRVDALSLVFGYVFGIAAFLGGLYAWHLNDRVQQAAALTYAGSAVGVVFAGDLVTVVVFWEMMAVASTYLIWAGGRERSRRAAIRYLFVHVVGGTFLLGGVLWHLGGGGGLEFTLFDGGAAAALVLIGFVINAAVPPLHAWLPDAYPEGSITGSVFLSAFTTKTAVYVLARGFAGWDILLPAGVFMALYGVFFAMMESDMRRLLAYHIVSQVGYMVAAVGIGTEIAINGAAAHAFAHVIYKGLLFMGAGATIYATGRRAFPDLGGIGHKMPLIVGLYMVGALSISAFPLFSGFTSKSLVIFAAEESHISWAVFLLYVTSVGTFLSTTLKLPYLTWFGPKRDDIPVRPVPWGMTAAMGVAAVLCIALGVYAPLLYNVLPFPVDYEPYSAYHVIWTVQLLAFTAIAFWLFLPRIYGEHATTLDTDWFYRKARRPVAVLVQQPLEWVFTTSERLVMRTNRAVASATMHPDRAWAWIAKAFGQQPAEHMNPSLGRPPLGSSLAVIMLLIIVIVLVASF